MPKYGRGLNREIVAAVNRGAILEPFGVREIIDYAAGRGWHPPESYTRSTLANASSGAHSQTYKKYFEALGEGRYALRPEYRDLD